MHPPGGDHAQHVLSSLNQQRAVGRFCDAMLKVGDGVVFMAHRNILACFSERFQEESNITPTKTCMEVSLQECPNDGLELLLNFVYTGELKLDPVNLERVQHAAVSLCVPRALTLCQQFRECSKEAVPIKRKRGRPKNSTAVRTAYCSEKEKRPVVLDKDEPSLDAGTVTATTTRSGRKVKGPRRLVGESPLIEATLPDRASKSGLLISTESSDGVQSPLQPTTETEMTELQVNIHDNGVCQVNEDEEDDVNFRGLTLEEDSDDDYVPVAQPTAPSASTTRRRKVPSKNDQKENGEAMEDDSKKGSVQCPTCDKTFRSKYYLKVHNRRHTGEKPFACMKCGKRYFRKENLSEHESRNCAKTYMYTCPTCDATFNKKQELRLHMIHHTGEMPNKCTSCTEQFMQKKDLTLHMIKIHGFPKPHACAQCTKCFLTRTELRVHEAAKHRGEKPFVCEECGHRASSRNGLQMHIKAIHRNERPFVCIHCGHAFTQKTNLNMHLRVHTGERPYQCHLCGKTFRTQASLYKHHRTHTGERPFSCEFCEQRFTEKGPLIRHIASKHQEGRPHCCNICSKTFKAMEQLRVHVHRHKGVRKFQCPDCGYKFTRQAHLRRHCQIHKRTENYNPRQRKLRNVIVEERDNEQSETEATENLLVTEEEGYTQHPASQETSNPEPGSMPVLDPTDIVRVVIHTIDPVMEELLPIQIQSVESLVVSDVLQQSQLVTRAYEPTMIVEAMVENVSES